MDALRIVMTIVLFAAAAGSADAQPARATIADGEIGYTFPVGWTQMKEPGFAIYAERPDPENVSRCGVKVMAVPNARRQDQATLNAAMASRPIERIAHDADKLLMHSTAGRIGNALVVAFDLVSSDRMLFKVRHFAIADDARMYSFQADCVTQAPDNAAIVRDIDAFLASAQSLAN